MTTNLIPPIPKEPIKESFQWRDWFDQLHRYIYKQQFGSFVIPVVNGGTGETTVQGIKNLLGITPTPPPSGGGSPIYSAKVPDLSQWTPFNNTGMTTSQGTVVSGKTTAISIQGNLSAPGGDYIQGLYKTSPTPPYRIAVAVKGQYLINNYQNVGIGFWTSSKVVIFGSVPSNGDGISVLQYPSTTSSGNIIASTPWQQHALAEMWLGLYNDGTNINYQFSCDSVTWVTVYSESNSTGYLGSSYSNPMLYVDAHSPNQQASILCQCWDENGLSRTVQSCYG